MNAHTPFRIVLALACLCSVPLEPLPAGGAAEEPEEPAHTSLTTLTSYLVLPSGAQVDERFLRQFYGTSALTAFTWNEFTLKDGAVTLSAHASVPGAQVTGTDTREAGGFTVREITLRTSGPLGPAEPRTHVESVTVSFTIGELLNQTGDVLFQPYRYALTQAVSRSGLRSGSVRLVKLTWNGTDRFEAEVETAGT